MERVEQDERIPAAERMAAEGLGPDGAQPTAYHQSPRTTATRYRDRVSYDRAAVHAVLDEALVCHVGFILDGAPVVLPTVHARVGDRLYFHGSTGGRFGSLDGERVGVTVTLLDGLALARSWMHHSAPFRCVVVHGTARLVRDEGERFEAMRALIEHVAPGRTAESRPPNKKELAATSILAVDLEQVSLKVRAMTVGDDAEDLELPYWAGVVPLRLTAGAPVPADDLRAGVPVPENVAAYRR